MTIADLISSLRGTNKEWTADSRITDRFIYNEGVSVRNTLLKQEEDRNRLYALTSLFTTLNKVELVDTDTIEACGIRSDCKIKRTKDKLPDTIDSSGGSSIRTVSSLDGSQILTWTTDLSWVRKLNIKDKHAKGELFYFFKGDYIYFPNISWDYVRVEAMFEDPDLIDRLNDCAPKGDCNSAYDREFTLPSYLEKGLKDLLNESLLRYYYRHPMDTHINKNPQT